MYSSEKFIRKRLQKLLGNDYVKPVDKPAVSKQEKQTASSQLFKDHTYVQFELRRGRESFKEDFRCFHDRKVFSGLPIPAHEIQGVDEDNDSHPNIVRNEISRCHQILITEVLERNRNIMATRNSKPKLDMIELP